MLPLQSYRDITSVLFCGLINVDILLLFSTIFICYKTEMSDNRHIVDVIYQHFFKLIYRSYRYTFHGHLMDFLHSYQSSCGRVVMTMDLYAGGRVVFGVRILPWTIFFVMFTCSVILAAGLAAFKWNQAWHSSEVIGAHREKDIFKNDREVKHLKECALALIKLYNKLLSSCFTI